jgi:hypothetical protein
MRHTEYLLIVVAEECGEIVLDSLDGKDLSLESADLLGAIELLEEQPDFQTLIVPFESICPEEYKTVLLEFQYHIFKSLRFGLNDKNPVLLKNNIENLSIYILKLKEFIYSLYIENIESLKEKKKEKILKFMNYSMLSGILHEER